MKRQPAKQRKRLSPGVLKNPVVMLALGLGAGLSPWAPGTAGTVVAAGLVVFLQAFSSHTYLLVMAGVILSGGWVCGYAARALKVHDHPAIVYDEVAGFLVTMCLVPGGWTWLLAGFALFRFFDAVKPWPISWVDRQVHGGFGIMLDDIIAGLVSLAILQLAVSLAGVGG